MIEATLLNDFFQSLKKFDLKINGNTTVKEIIQELKKCEALSSLKTISTMRKAYASYADLTIKEIFKNKGNKNV